MPDEVRIRSPRGQVLGRGAVARALTWAFVRSIPLGPDGVRKMPHSRWTQEWSARAT